MHSDTWEGHEKKRKFIEKRKREFNTHLGNKDYPKNMSWWDFSKKMFFKKEKNKWRLDQVRKAKAKGKRAPYHMEEALFPGVSRAENRGWPDKKRKFTRGTFNKIPTLNKKIMRKRKRSWSTKRSYKKRKYSSGRSLVSKCNRGNQAYKMVKKLIQRKEPKYIDFSLGETVMTIAAPIVLENWLFVDQGDEQDERTGDEVYLKYIQFKIDLKWTLATAKNVKICVMLVCDKKNDGTAAPAITDILTDTSEKAFVKRDDIKDRGRYQIIHRKWYLPTTARLNLDRETTGNTTITRTISIYHKFKNAKISYSTATPTTEADVGEKCYWLMMWPNDTTASTYYALVKTRMRFEDP